MSRRGHVTKDTDSGLWGFVVDVAPVGAKRRQLRRRGFRTKRAAQEALTELLGQVQRDDFVSPTKVTVGEYLEAWCDGLTSGSRLRPSTVASYRSNLDLHVIPHIGTGRLHALTATDLDRLYAELLASGRRSKKGGGLSARTVRYIHTIVHGALADALRKGLVARNVAAQADPPAASAAKAPEMATWTPEDLRTFLDSVADDRLYPLWRTAALTGMRRGELLGLRWSEVTLDDSAGIIRVVRQLVGVDDGHPVLSEGKTDRARRSIDIDAETVAVLRAHRAAQLKERMLVGAGWRDHDLVFTGPDGSPLEPDRITKMFGRLVRSTGAPRIRLHDLRHSHATHLIAAGVHAKVVSERLGHASVAFTLDRYGHVLPNLQAGAATAVAALVDAP